jgi:hypothetical protein
VPASVTDNTGMPVSSNELLSSLERPYDAPPLSIVRATAAEQKVNTKAFVNAWIDQRYLVHIIV